MRLLTNLINKDYNADTSSVAYILDEFSYYFETPYDETNASFPDCTIDRPSGASADGRMGLVNHMLHIEILGIQIPNQAAADTTNSVDSIDAQAAICEGLYGRTPNVVLVSCPLILLVSDVRCLASGTDACCLVFS